MRTVILEAFTDESTGVLGLGVQGMRRDETTNAATDGLMIAHDLIEHVNGVDQIGTIDDELEALGAIWYVRGQHSDLRRDGVVSRYSPEENISSDVVRMFRDHFEGGAYVGPAPRTQACEADDAFDAILEYACSDFADEVDTDAADYESARQAYVSAARARMRIGYRKAKRKYEGRGRSRFAANSLFWAIADAVSPRARRADEGAQFKLVYGFDTTGDVLAHCEEHYGDDDYA